MDDKVGIRDPESLHIVNARLRMRMCDGKIWEADIDPDGVLAAKLMDPRENVENPAKEIFEWALRFQQLKDLFRILGLEEQVDNVKEK